MAEQTELVRMDEGFVDELNDLSSTLPKRIRSQVQYQSVQSALAFFAGMRRRIREKYAPFKRSALDHLNLLRQGEKDDLAKCQPYERVCQTLITKWEEEREEQARQELEAAMEEAEKKAQAERDQQLAVLAKEIDAAGESDKAVLSGVRETLGSRPLEVAYTPVKQPYSRPEGHSVRQPTYQAQVINLKMLVEAIVAGHADIQCVQPATTYLNSRARREKEQLCIPGVVAVAGERKTIIRNGRTG